MVVLQDAYLPYCLPRKLTVTFLVYDNAINFNYVMTFLLIASYVAFRFEYPFLLADTLAFCFSFIFWFICSLHIWIELLMPESPSLNDESSQL